MANPQIEDGHLDLANEIVDALAKIRIAGEEMQCLWVILRKTYGWHKKQDNIALSQFCEMTNLNKPAICRALQKLLSKKIILIIKNDNGITTYGFNKDFEQWQPLSKKITLSKKIMSVIKNDKRSLSKKRHTKENYTKETITKEKIARSSKTKRAPAFCDDEFIKALKQNPAYEGIDIDRELGKLDAWLLTPKGRGKQRTQQRFLNWLNRAERPMNLQSKPIISHYEEKDPIPELREAIKKGWK